MGSGGSKLDGILDDLATLTYLSKAEILHCFNRFRIMNKEAIEASPSKELVPIDKVIENFEELQANPFAERICQVFSQNGEEMTFVDFIDLASCFSETAPPQFKADWVFKIFDYNGDGRIGSDDLSVIVVRLTGDKLEQGYIEMLVQKVLEEVDTKKMGYLEPADFRNLMLKSSNFAQNFCIRF